MRNILFATVAIVACAGAGLALAGNNQRGHHSLFEAADADHDGVVTRQEYDAGRDAMFARMDADHDGQLARADRRRRHGQERGEHHRMGPRDADANHDGAISRDEFLARPIAQFARLDANGDGAISADERSHRGRRAEGLGHRERRHADADGDHQISRSEFSARSASVFDRLDANDDGRVTREEAAHAHGHGRGHGRE
jgi:Ca2+-binding EF-hand superfamily protein